MLKIELKPIGEQVAVVMGASSGIGRATALELSAAGAKVVVAGRGEEALNSLAHEIELAGGEAVVVVADVTRFEELENVAQVAIENFGRIDTWVHTAAAAMYATFEETTPDEFKRIVDVTLTGAAWGAMVALPHLKKSGGALIQVSSVEALVGIPYQSAYASAKHGMKAYLDVLRLELERAGAPVSVTNIMPTGINTPFFNNARTKIGVKPTPPPPIYQPHIVARAIVAAAQKPIPEIVVGGGGAAFAYAKRFAPRLADWLLKPTFQLQKTDEPKSQNAPDNLDAPNTRDARVEGDYSAQARGTSVWTWLETHPPAKKLVSVGALGLLLWAIKRRAA